MYKKEEFATAEWLVMGVLTGLLGLGAAFIPFVNIVIPFFWAVPIGLLLVKYGVIQGVLGLLVAGVVWYLGFGSVWALLLTAIIGCVGLSAGLAIRLTNSLKKAVVFAAMLSMLLNLGLLAGNYSALQQSFASTKAEVKEILPQVFATYRETMQETNDLPSMGEETFIRATMDLLQLAWQLLPAMLAAVSAVVAFVNTLFLYRWLLRKGFIRGYPDFVTIWRLPWYTIWLTILAISAFLLGDELPQWRLVGINALLLVAVLSFVYGMLVVGYYWLRWNLSPLMRVILITMFVMYWPVLVLLTMFLGTFDPILNFRRLGLPIDKD